LNVKPYMQRFAYEWDEMKAWLSEQESKDEGYQQNRKREKEVLTKILELTDEKYLDEAQSLLDELDSIHVDELVLEGQLIFSYAIAWFIAKDPRNDPEIARIMGYIQAKE